MRIVFMGSSEASAMCLKAILRKSSLQVVGVVTPPDRPSGRGRKLTPCPCRAYAAECGITEVITPENVNDEASMAQLRAWRPDVVAVVAYGQFLKKPLLDLPALGCFNCHFSLLPKFRGASPVIAALAAGEMVTGVSVIRMGVGMDDGPVLQQRYEPIYSDTTGGALMGDLSVVGGLALADVLARLERGQPPVEVPQCEEDATFAHKLKKTDGLIDWRAPVLDIARRIRAYAPWPGCFTYMPARFRRKGSEGRLGVIEAKVVGRIADDRRSSAPGMVIEVLREGPVVRCGDTSLLLTMLKPEGGKVLKGREFLAGRRLVPGDVLGND